MSASNSCRAAATTTPIVFCWTTTVKTTIPHTPNTETTIMYYLNPVSGNTLNISIADNNTIYKTINMKGEEIALGTIQNKTVSVANLPVGVYFLEINLGNKKVNKKFVKL